MENQFTEISPLVSPFPGGLEHHEQLDSQIGNSRRANANDLRIAQKATALRAGRVVDNRFERAHKHGPQFDAADLLAIPGATPARFAPVHRNFYFSELSDGCRATV